MTECTPEYLPQGLKEEIGEGLDRLGSATPDMLSTMKYMENAIDFLRYATKTLQGNLDHFRAEDLQDGPETLQKCDFLLSGFYFRGISSLETQNMENRAW